MFALTDMIVIQGIEKALENLRENPHHLEFILGAYSATPFLKNLHGKDYIRNCMELISHNKIQIRPYYVLDSMQLPSISVVATYSESELMLGDFIGQQSEELAPRLLGKFDATSIAQDSLSIFTPNEFAVSNFAFPGTYLHSGCFSAQIEMTIPGDTQTQIFVTTPLPAKLRGWEVKTMSSRCVATINSSGNSCTVMLKIKSSGDVETHKLLCMILRYCLRYSRMFFENHNLYVSTTNQDMLVLEDDTQMMFATVFSMQGKSFDSWIEYEQKTPDTILLDVDAVPVDTENNSEVGL